MISWDPLSAFCFVFLCEYTLFDQRFLCIAFFPSFNVFLVRFSGKLNIYSEVWILTNVQTWYLTLKSTSKLMLMSRFLRKQVRMNFLKFRGDQESGRVLCIQGPFFFKEWCWVVFPQCAVILFSFSHQDRAFSVLSDESDKHSNVSSVTVKEP